MNHWTTTGQQLNNNWTTIGVNYSFVVYWFWLTVLFINTNLVYTSLFLFLYRLSVLWLYSCFGLHMDLCAEREVVDGRSQHECLEWLFRRFGIHSVSCRPPCFGCSVVPSCSFLSWRGHRSSRAWGIPSLRMALLNSIAIKRITRIFRLKRYEYFLIHHLNRFWGSLAKPCVENLA